jgi:hypothetical protein
MPKQVKDKSKATRMIHVKEAIQKYGKCSHREISEYVSTKIGSDPKSSSFKKAIYNDLNGFIGDNIIGVEYRTRDGETIPLDEEDDYLNKRNSFYYILGDESETDGAGLLKEMGIRFQPQKSSLPEWKVSNIKNKHLPKKDKVFVMLPIHSQYLALEVNKDEVPLTLIIAGDGQYTPSHEKLDTVFDSHKVALLSIPEEYLEESSVDRLGHFFIDIYKNDDEKIECNIDYLVDKGTAMQIDKKIEENKGKWETVLKERDFSRALYSKNISLIYDFIEENEIQEDEKLTEDLKSKLLSLMPKWFAQHFDQVSTALDLKKKAYQDYKKYDDAFQELDKISCVDYDDVKISKVTYSRVNDFIDDANVAGKLKLPPVSMKGKVKNLGNRNTLHARKPPKFNGKKVVYKRDFSKMEQTENFQMWTNLHCKPNELPINIKSGPRFQIIVSDFYPDSSYTQKELDKLYKVPVKKKKAA